MRIDIDGPRGWGDHKFFADLAIVVILLILLMNLILTAGCVTQAKRTAINIIDPPTPTPTPTPIPPTPTPEPTPTPTPSPYYYNHTYDPLVAGDRNLAQPYRFTVKNVSGYADAEYSVSVYDYRLLKPYITFWSLNWGQWFYQETVRSNRYLAVWVHTELSPNSTTWYGYWQEDFYLWYDNITLRPEPVLMEDISRHINRKEYFPAVIRDVQNLTRRDRLHGDILLPDENYGWRDGIEQERIEPGTSPAWDGFILYSVPSDLDVSHIAVILATDPYYGVPVWWLTEREISRREGKDAVLEYKIPDVRGINARR